MINLMMTTSKRIYQLPVHLANQIAAGEVVERPASVLKELLENSLDADSTHIEITLEQGGTKLIRVQDNGTGICKEDLELAIAPHATSKIKTLSDLEGVVSYGFRGEALASIGSVSKLQVSSCVTEQETGFSIRREGRDSVPTLSPTPKRQGTCIEVRDLFYNTPARRHFLKSEKTELAYLEEVFKRIALSKPHIAFKFQSGDRLPKQLPACKTLETQTRRVAKLCGKSFIENAYYVQAESNGLKLTGWLGSEKALRSQADLQYFYVNGRIVRDKVVSHAVRQAYQKICLPGRYPAFVLYFELDPNAVDVNVHPTKHEVRFREARTVHAFISYAIQEGLQQGDRAELELDLPEQAQAQTQAQEQAQTQTQAQIQRQPYSQFQSQPQQSQSRFQFQAQPQTQMQPELQSSNFKQPIPEYRKVPNTLFGKPLLVLGGELLLTENNNEFMMVDVKKIQTEMIHKQLLEAYLENAIPKLPLLMPESVLLGEVTVDSIDAEQLDWERLGFEWNQAGQASILVRAMPEMFGNKIDNLTELLQKLLKLKNVEACISLITNHIVKTQTLSLDGAKDLIDNFEISMSLEEGEHTHHFYRKFSLEQLRLFLVSK